MLKRTTHLFAVAKDEHKTSAYTKVVLGTHCHPSRCDAQMHLLLLRFVAFAVRWLAASETINHHRLADFRVGHQKALKELFAQFLTLLEEAGMVDLRILNAGRYENAGGSRESILASARTLREAAAAGAPSGT
jgi:hypothetical protein